jgi:hypothetical protein
MSMTLGVIWLLAGVLVLGQDAVTDIMMGNRGSPATIEGNLIDLDCFVEHGGFGPEHDRCSRICAQKGLPAAIIDSRGNVYLIQGRKHQLLAQVNEPLLEHMESTVIVHGELLQRLDLRVLVVEKIVRAPRQQSWESVRALYDRKVQVSR